MAIHEVWVTAVGKDPEGDDIKKGIHDVPGLTDVRTATVTRLQGDLTEEEVRTFAARVLADPINQRFTVNTPIDLGTDNTVDIRHRPGVTNPDSAPILKAAHDSGLNKAEAADTSDMRGFHGSVKWEETSRIVGRLMNPMIQEIVTEKPQSLTFEGPVGPVEVIPILDLTDDELMELSRDKLFLDLEEMQAIQEYFRGQGRNPRDVEMEHIAAAWSEHCNHKTFSADVIVDGERKAPLFSRIKQTAAKHFERAGVISAFHDNAGVIKFYADQAIAAKKETHNSPSALDPVGGAMTGSGGVYRDIAGTGLGARNIISTDMFIVGPPDLPDSDMPEGTIRPDQILRGVVKGVERYGNRMGIPTGNGSVHFDRDFRAKPTVMVGALGIIPEKYAHKGTPQSGDLVVAIGGRTGKDGLHGATFSSAAMTDKTEELHSSAVQIGEAIEEKRTFDALLEARNADLLQALTDCGAAGFASAIGEMGEGGVTVDLERAPLKYTGLAPWEIWLSESQERMVAAVSPDNFEAFRDICAKHNVEVSALGEFNDSGTLTINYGEQNVAELDFDFIKNGLPQRVMEAKWEQPDIPEIVPDAPQTSEEWVDLLKKILAHGDVCSKEAIVRQYDHGVQGGNVVSPYGGKTQKGPNDAQIVRPMLGESYGVAEAHGVDIRVARIHPRKGVEQGVAEAAANFVAVGGDIRGAAAVGNYVTASPDPDTMGALDMMVDGACEMMDVLEVPVISGKDSLSSTYIGRDGEVIKIPPVYTQSIFGRIPDVEKTMTSDIKAPGKSRLYMIGVPSEGMGGSIYYEVAGGSSSHVPTVDKQALPKNLAAVTKLIQSEKVLAAHDVSDGGLFTTIAEMCFGSDAGAEIILPKGVDRTTFLLSQTAGCIVVEVPDNMNIYMEVLKDFALGEVTVTSLGRTTDEPTIAATEYALQGYDFDRFFAAPTSEFQAAWEHTMKEVFHG